MSRHTLAFTLNGKPVEVDVDAGWTLMQVLRDEIGLRLVREGAPDARVDFPLEQRDSGLAIEVRHPRIAAKGEGVRYTLYGASGVVADQWTLTPTID